MSFSYNFNWPIIGHTQIIEYFRHSLANGSLGHAYLFHGPDDVGKTHLAKLIARSILCESYGNPLTNEPINQLTTIPCGKCSTCRQIEKGNFADLHIVEREDREKKEGKKAFITVEQIRELQDKIGKRSFSNSYKIVIIPEAETMNQEASNSLLKTLEEPTERTIIFLIASNKELMLPTIQSRSQSFKFLPIKKAEIYDYLLSNGATRDEAQSLSSLSHGRPTVAMQLLSNSAALATYRTEQEQLLGMLSNGSLVEKFQLAESLTKDRDVDQIDHSLERLSSLARDLFLIKVYNENNVGERHLLDQLQPLAAKIGLAELKGFLANIEKTRDYLRRNVNPKMAVECLVM